MFNRLIATFAIFGTMACGYLDGSPLAILAGAVVLASLRSEAHFAFSDKYAAHGWFKAWALFAGASIAGNAMWCALAFTVGLATALAS